MNYLMDYHMDVPVLTEQQRLAYFSYVQTQDAT